MTLTIQYMNIYKIITIHNHLNSVLNVRVAKSDWVTLSVQQNIYTTIKIIKHF